MDDTKKARLMARVYMFLGRRIRSEHEVREFLEKHKGEDIPAEGVEDILVSLKKDHYIDDAAFARTWIESRIGHKPKSPWLLRYELKKKGVSESIINNVMDEFSFSRDDQLNLVIKALGRKIIQWQKLPVIARKTKLLTFMKYRGFSTDLIDDLVEKIRGNEYNTE